MYAHIEFSIDLENDKPQPKYNEYINDEYYLKDHVRDILKSRLVNAGIRFAKSHEIREFEEFYRYVGISIPKTSEPTYRDQVDEDAKELVTEYFMDEIITQLIDEGEASDDINNDYDGGDSTFHETIVDKWYSPEDGIKLLDDLSEHEETDSGLWEGRGRNYEDIISTKAAYTYGNAVYSKWHDIIEEINEIDMDEVRKLAIRSALKNMSKKNITIEDRQQIKEDGLDSWLMECHEDLYRNNLTNILKAEIEALL